MATIRCPLYEASSVAPQEAFCYDGMRRHTYFETEGRVQDLRARLVESGLKEGQRLGVCLPNSYELIVLLFAAWRCGASVLLISPRLPVSERAWQAERPGTQPGH